jgi:nitroreductase
MDISEAIIQRRSIRQFTEQDIPEETVERLINAARWAPSAGNIQPWDFVIVKKAETKTRLANAALDQQSIEQAPIVIVVCANEVLSAQRYGDRGKALFCLQDTAAAIQNILLFAYSIGLGTCWIGAFTEEQVREIIKVPEGSRPIAIVAVGHPGETPQPRRRKPTSEITHYETF